MKFIYRQKKRIISYLILLIILFFFLVPLFSLFYFFNETQTKHDIVAKFNNQNYAIAINGHITPELWHGLSIKVHSISVSNQNHQQLLHIGNMICQFSWLDAVFGHYKLKRISINDVDVYEGNFIRNGMNNLFNNNFHPTILNTLNYLEINDIHSVGSGLSERFDDGNLKIFLNEEIPEFKFGINLLNQNLYLNIDGALNNYNSEQLQFANFHTSLYNDNLSLITSGNAVYNFAQNALTLNIANGIIKFANYNGKIRANPVIISRNGIQATNTQLDLNLSHNLEQQKLNLKFIDLASNDFSTLFSHHASLNYSASVDNNAIKINTDFLDTQLKNDGSILSTLCKNKLYLTAPDFIHTPIEANVAGKCSYLSTQKLFNFNLAGVLNNSPVKLNLQVLTLEKPQITVSGNISQLDVSNFEKNNILPLYYDKSKLPFAWLSYLTMRANLTFDKLLLNLVTLTHVTTNFSISNNKLTVNDVKANILGGKLEATGSIHRINNQYNIKTQQKFINLDLKSVFKNIFDVNAISGRANIITDLRIDHVTSYDELHKNLNGKVNIDANNGAFSGIDFDLFISPKTLSLTTIKSTPFKELNASFNFVNGVSKYSAINFSSPNLITTGMGSVDFLHTLLDYNLTIKSLLPNNNEKIKGLVIPVKASGDLFDPKIEIQKVYLSNKQPINAASTKHHHKKHHRLLHKHKAK